LLLPVTALALFLRVTFLRAALGNWEAVLESTLAFVTGAAAARWNHRGWRPVLALALAMLLVTAAMGGPIAVLTSSRAAALFFAFAPIYAVCGLALAAMASLLSRRFPH
jgi:hypothetical protein